MVHRRRLDPPAAAQLEAAPRLVREGWHRDAVLEGDPAAAPGFHAQGWRPFRGRLRADARRQKEPEYDVNQDEAGEPAGRAQRGALWPPPWGAGRLAQASTLDQSTNGSAAVELEGCASGARAFGSVEAPHQGFDPRDDRGGDTQLIDAQAHQQRHRPEIAGHLAANADPAGPPVRGLD